VFHQECEQGKENPKIYKITIKEEKCEDYNFGTASAHVVFDR
jgi:hypothetical protein